MLCLSEQLRLGTWKRKTVTSDIASGWRFEIDEGPEWLFLRLCRVADDYVPEPPVATRGWALVEERQKRRIVFELSDGVMLTSYLAGQLILLHKRAEMVDGVFRICGFSSHANETLKIIRVADRFPNYANREDAVLGRLPSG